MRTLLREPLLHFLLLGAGLFFAYNYFYQDIVEADPQTIVVNRDKLVTFIQYRARAFAAEQFGEKLDALPKPELQRIIESYVREEALYREAKALQLDRNDYVSRLRLIQQLEFITRGLADAQVHPTQKEINRYYEAHKERYRVAPKVTFTHVFFSLARHGPAQAEALARSELRNLNRGRVRFDQAPAYGERFLYHVNYVEREPEEVVSHFGHQMQALLFALAPSDSAWRGPFLSSYGFHLVLLTRSEAGYLPPLDDVRVQVEQEARQAALDARFEESVQSIVKTYKVKVEAVEPPVAKAPS